VKRVEGEEKRGDLGKLRRLADRRARRISRQPLQRPQISSNGVEVTRNDDRVGFALRASRRLTGLWRAFLDTSYYRNRSNLDTYDYSRYQAMVGIEAVFEK